MTAEGNETSGGEPGRGVPPGGFGAEGAARRSEGDLLAERRARRAAESGEVALTRRAEAAEATVQTLERHVSSLQQRLHEAEEERLRAAELLEAEKAAALEREHELRLVKQREYAEQQLRVEVEERLVGRDREGLAESERLSRRLSVSEAGARELSARLEQLQRQLAEAEQTAAAGRAELHRAERDLQARLDQLEERAAQMQRGLDAERAARERSEAQLAAMSRGHGQMQRLVGEMKAIVERLTGAVAAAQQRNNPAVQERSAATVQERTVSAAQERSVPAAQQRSAPTAQQRRVPADSDAPPGRLAAPAARERSAPAAGGRVEASAQARGTEMADALAAAVERLRARAEAAAPELHATPTRQPALPPHKHSLSLIGRWRRRRKQRRSR
jgi:chromosome segregation ATPase